MCRDSTTERGVSGTTSIYFDPCPPVLRFVTIHGGQSGLPVPPSKGILVSRGPTDGVLLFRHVWTSRGTSLVSRDVCKRLSLHGFREGLSSNVFKTKEDL